MAQNEPLPLRIALAGSVSSSRRILENLLRHNAQVVGVFGLASTKMAGTSGYTRMDDLSSSVNIPYVEFENINSPEIIATVRKWSLDLLFVVGLSQIVKSELLSIPRLGCVGFHPTPLPQGRGRAPIAWLTLERRSGAATFFLMDQGIDSGPILAQEPFFVSEHDYAFDVIGKMEHAIDQALNRWLPRLLNGEWYPIAQSQIDATYYGRRSPEDGLIHWEWSAQKICALVQAASHPHPGAYSYVAGYRLKIWHASIETELPNRGVIGRILAIDNDNGWLVQTGSGLVWLTEVEFDRLSEDYPVPKLKIGVKLGFSPEDEIYLLKQKIVEINERLCKLEQAPKQK